MMNNNPTWDQAKLLAPRFDSRAPKSHWNRYTELYVGNDWWLEIERDFSGLNSRGKLTSKHRSIVYYYRWYPFGGMMLCTEDEYSRYNGKQANLVLKQSQPVVNQVNLVSCHHTQCKCHNNSSNSFSDAVGGCLGLLGLGFILLVLFAYFSYGYY